MSTDRKGRLRGVYVMVVDDQADSRDTLAAYLRYCGAHVHTAASGSEALSDLTTVKVDVLVLDYTMPGMSGFELLARIRKMPGQARRPTPAILYTAADDLMEAAETAGFAAYLVKPLEPRLLLAEIARLAGV